MKYVFTNFICLGLLVYTTTLMAQDNEETNEEEKENYEPDWNKTIQDIERDAQVHDSWQIH